MIKTDIKLPLNYSIDGVKAAVCAALPIKKDELADVVIIKRSLNLSDKAGIHYDATVGLSLDGEREAGLLKMRKRVGACDISRFKAAKYTPALRPVIAGFGPAGMFAALTLAEAGARPIVIERGEDIDARIKSVGRFFRCGELNEKSNVQFGEGGAGTFSDGKLKVGTKDKYKYRILDELIEGGGSPEILYSTTAHLGTDKLPQIVKHVRE
ncbi:MAG: hypothetical protein IIX96_01355, partial [Clostridia bacterium]|nr:hypothetical protein [Clostridia bacterium]